MTPLHIPPVLLCRLTAAHLNAARMGNRDPERNARLAAELRARAARRERERQRVRQMTERGAA